MVPTVHICSFVIDYIAIWLLGYDARDQSLETCRPNVWWKKKKWYPTCNDGLMMKSKWLWLVVCKGVFCSKTFCLGASKWKMSDVVLGEFTSGTINMTALEAVTWHVHTRTHARRHMPRRKEGAKKEISAKKRTWRQTGGGGRKRKWDTVPAQPLISTQEQVGRGAQTVGKKTKGWSFPQPKKKRWTGHKWALINNCNNVIWNNTNSSALFLHTIHAETRHWNTQNDHKDTRVPSCFHYCEAKCAASKTERPTTWQGTNDTHNDKARVSRTLQVLQLATPITSTAA